MPRPSDYSQEIANKICELVANGSNINAITSANDMPSRTTVYAWFRKEPEFLNNYIRAREDRADSRSDRIDDICEKMISKEIDYNVGRVVIDAMKWQAGKEKPKIYGDKITQEHSGHMTFSNLSDEALEARIAAKMVKDD